MTPRLGSWPMAAGLLPFLTLGGRLVGAGLGGPWALGVLVLTGQVAAGVSGPCAAAALLLAACAAILAALCHAEVSRHRHASSYEAAREILGVRGALALGWAGATWRLAALAACARGLGATVDYIAGGRMRATAVSWLHRLEIPELANLGPPDPLASGATAFTTILFVLGLERSRVLKLLLNASIALALLFFVGEGAAHCEPDIWSTHPFLPAGAKGLITGAALSSAGFLGVAGVRAESARCWARHASQQSPKSPHVTRRLELVACLISVVASTASYLAVALVLTMMVNFRALSPDSPALVQAFEVRDVDWARLVMATLGISALAVALVELAPPLHRLVRALAADGMLPRALARHCALTGTGAASIIVSGALVSILALLAPLSCLLQLAAGATLASNMVIAGCATIMRFQPHPADTEVSSDSQPATTSTVRELRSRLGAIPAAVRRAGEACRWGGVPGTGGSRTQEERVPLVDGQGVDSAEESERGVRSLRNTFSCNSELSGYESDSSVDSSTTDIDAVVAEFKEKIKVATLSDYAPQSTEPDAVTARRASFALLAAFITGSIACALLLMVLEENPSVWPIVGLVTCSLLTAVFLGLAARQPKTSARFMPYNEEACSHQQRSSSRRSPQPWHRPQKGELTIQVPLAPWLPSLTVLFHVLLLCQLISVAWFPLTVAALPGLISAGVREWRTIRRRGVVSRRRGERIHLHAPPLHLMRPTLIPSHQRLPQHAQARLTTVDTILIAR